MFDERFGHFPGIVFALLAQAGISFVAVLLLGSASATEVRLTALNVKIEQIEDDALGQVAESAIVDNHSLSRVDHLDVVQVLLLDRLVMRYARVDAVEVIFDCILGRPSDVVRGGDLDRSNVLLDDTLVSAGAFDEQGLNVLFFKLLGQSVPPCRERVDSIEDSDLSVLVIQEMENVFSALFQDFVPQQDRGGARIDKEIVVGNLAFGTHVSSAVVPEMEDVSLDT